MRAASSHGRQRRLPFPPDMGAPVALGLDFTRQALADWHLLPPGPGRSPHLADDALLIVGELTANACRYGHGPRELRLQRLPGRLRIEVSDHNPATPHRRSTNPAQAGGHGIPIIERLTTDWGTEPTPGGKTVWANLPTAPPHTAAT